MELLTVGRSGVDLYPLEIGVGLEEVTTFGKFLGGSPTNVAVAAARLGVDAAVVTGVGDDPLGRYVRAEIERLGVDPAHVRTVADLPTPITLCEIFPPDDFPLYFYRRPSAPDLQLGVEDLPAELVSSVPIFWFSGTGLSVEPTRAAHEAALEARGRARHTVFDLDYRPMVWADLGEVRDVYERAVARSTVVVGNLAECEAAVGESDAERAASALLERGVELAVVKRGPRGTLARTVDERVEVPPVPVEVVNGLGAGDAFGGALCRGLLSGWSLGRTIEAANAAGAIVASRLECSTAMPTPEELEAVLSGTAVAELDASSSTTAATARVIR